MTTIATAAEDAIWTRIAAALGIPASIAAAVRTPWVGQDKPPVVIVEENAARFAAYLQRRDELTEARLA